MKSWSQVFEILADGVQTWFVSMLFSDASEVESSTRS